MPHEKGCCTRRGVAWQGEAQRAKGRRRTCSSLRRSSSSTPLCSSCLSSVSAGGRCSRCAFAVSARSLRRLGPGASNAASRDGCCAVRAICWRSWRLRWSSSATCLCCPSVCTWRAMRWMQQAAAAASASSMIGVGALAVWGPFVLSRSWRGTGWEGALQRTTPGYDRDARTEYRQTGAGGGLKKTRPARAVQVPQITCKPIEETRSARRVVGLIGLPVFLLCLDGYSFSRLAETQTVLPLG